MCDHVWVMNMLKTSTSGGPSMTVLRTEVKTRSVNCGWTTDLEYGCVHCFVHYTPQ